MLKSSYVSSLIFLDVILCILLDDELLIVFVDHSLMRIQENWTKLSIFWKLQIFIISAMHCRRKAKITPCEISNSADIFIKPTALKSVPTWPKVEMKMGEFVYAHSVLIKLRTNSFFYRLQWRYWLSKVAFKAPVLE